MGRRRVSDEVRSSILLSKTDTDCGVLGVSTPRAVTVPKSSETKVDDVVCPVYTTLLGRVGRTFWTRRPRNSVSGQGRIEGPRRQVE